MIENYPNIELYLDNDKAGKNATEILKNTIPSAIDFSQTYSNHKDLNAYLLSKINHQKEAKPNLKIQHR